jgi:CHAT domain-containing protein
VDVRTIEVGDPQDLQASLKRIHAYMSHSQSSQAETIQTDLEKLYNIFIRPISDLLDGMKHEDKLIFALDDVGN